MTEKRSFNVILPWPHRGLSPNSRINRFQKARLFKATKDQACLLTKKALLDHQIGRVKPILDDHSKHFGKRGGTVNVQLICTPPTNRYRDEDNMIALCKAVIDGISSAIQVDDCCFHYREQVWFPAKQGNLGSLEVVCDWEEE